MSEEKRSDEAVRRFEMQGKRIEVLREARVVGMVAAIEHLVGHSPLPIDFAFINRHLGVDGRGPEADAVAEAVMRLMSGKRLWLTGDHRLVGASSPDTDNEREAGK